MAKFVNFLQEVRVELSKVSWPNSKQLTIYTLAVVRLSLFLAVFLGALDFSFVTLLNKFVLR